MAKRKIRTQNKLVKNHAKKKFIIKRYNLVDINFKDKLLYNVQHVPRKTKKWIFRRLAKKRLVLNYRIFFTHYGFKNLNIQKIDPLKKLFHRFVYPRLISLAYYKLTEYHLELIRRLARKLFGKRVFIRLLIKASFNILRRTSNVRMGGGKGAKLYNKVYFLYPGCSILEIRGSNKRLVGSFLRLLQKKMAFDLKIVNINRI